LWATLVSHLSKRFDHRQVVLYKHHEWSHQIWTFPVSTVNQDSRNAIEFVDRGVMGEALPRVLWSPRVIMQQIRVFREACAKTVGQNQIFQRYWARANLQDSWITRKWDSNLKLDLILVWCSFIMETWQPQIPQAKTRHYYKSTQLFNLFLIIRLRVNQPSWTVLRRTRNTICSRFCI